MLIFSRYTWWVATMVGLALMLAIAGQTGALNPFQGLFLKATAPVEDALSAIFQPIASFLSNATNVNDLQDENRRLRLENEDLRNQLTSGKQDAERVKELQEALNITQGATSGTRLAANVVHRDNSAFSDVISVDRGSNDGIKSGMVVLSSQGSLLGTVTTVFGDAAFVRLITDSKSKVAAQLVDSKVDGIVRGGANRALTFDLAQADIKVGDTVVTSGLGGNYPAGIPIGQVSEVSGTSQDIFRKVKVDPAVRVSTVHTVLVLTSFLPQRITLDSQ